MNATIEHVGDVPWLKMETKHGGWCGVEAAAIYKISPARGLDDDTILMVYLRHSPGSPITTTYPPEDFNALFGLLRQAMEKLDDEEIKTPRICKIDVSPAGREADGG